MQAGKMAISQRGNYTPSKFTLFLWWLSTAEQELLMDTTADRNRYRITGMCVLATWAFASLAWIYFFVSIVDALPLAIFLGLFMGFIILTIDRALIKGINADNRTKRFPILFRGILALTIGTFMAQPAILFLFDSEVKLQTSLDNEKRKQVKKDELTALYNGRKRELETEKVNIKKELDRKYAAVTEARNSYLAESDGSGGTGKVGLKTIALAKKAEYQKLDEEYRAMSQKGLPEIDSINAALKGIAQKIQQEEAIFEKYLNNGFLTRIEALNNLLKNNPALQYRYYLILVILVLIELMPVLAKTLLPSGSYDEKVKLRDAMERAIAGSNSQKEQQLKELYNQLAFENDTEAIRAFYDMAKTARKEKIQEMGRQWTGDSQQSFDGLWNSMKKDILSKQEN